MLSAMTKQEVLVRLREDFAALGHPVEGLTDEELERSVALGIGAVRTFGAAKIKMGEAQGEITRAFDAFKKLLQGKP